MASTAELARYHTTLREPAVEHLHRLVASWGLLADLCFADLLLMVPVTRADALGDAVTGRSLVVLGQVRPLTSQTLYRADLVGSVIAAEDRSEVFRCWELGEIIDTERMHEGLREPVRTLCIPVRYGEQTIAVLTRESTPSVGRQPGELERTYRRVFARLAQMVSAGMFPFPDAGPLSDESPRVGDGVLVLDASGRVEYASPNAVSALHRVGVHANTEGMSLSELGLDPTAVDEALSNQRPTVEELEKGSEVTVLLHCLPLVEHSQSTGGLIVLRDISELRRRDRLLMTKDATIREIHHRVKNNLQTISSLLRLQGRRVTSPESRAGIEESVRRIRSIALVHETLAHGIGENVRFGDVLGPLTRMVEESLTDPERPVNIQIRGDAGVLPATVATSLAVVLSELLQNVVDHGFPAQFDSGPGHVVVELANDGRELQVRLSDDGIGVAEDFEIEQTTSLGLSIVRTLVTSEMQGTIRVTRGEGPAERTGTVVDLRVPVDGQLEPITGVVPAVKI